MQYVIQLGKKAVGEVELVHEGLYDRICAQCELQEGIYRLYLDTKSCFDSLGVPAPQNGMLTLKKRVPAGRYSIDAESSFFLSQTEPWRKYEGQLPIIPNERLRSDSSKGYLRLCEVLAPDQPLSLLPYFCFCRPYVLYGRQAVLFELTEENRKRASAES